MARKKEQNSTQYSQLEEGANRAKPVLRQHAREFEPFNKIARLPNALDEVVCAKSIENLNQLLADTMTLRDMYKKHHWQVAGPTLYQLPLLFVKRPGEQAQKDNTTTKR